MIVPGPGLVWGCGKRLAGEEVWRGFVGSAVAGFREEVFGLDGAQPSLGHEATDSGRSASQASIGEFGRQAAVAVASAVAPEDGLDQVAHASVGDLPRGGCGGVVEAAASLAERGADLADTTASFQSDEVGSSRGSRLGSGPEDDRRLF